MTPNIGQFFGPVAKALYSTFLPALFGEPIDSDDPRLALAPLPVKHAGLALPSPVDSAAEHYKASTLLCGHLLGALKGSHKFSSADHRSTISEVRAELRERNSTRYGEALTSILRNLPRDTRRTIQRGCDTGAWLSVLPNAVHGTELSAQEFRDSLFLRYARTPPGLPSSCDGCGQSFSVRHALQCHNGGLITMRHNELRDELCDLAARAFAPSAVRDEPKINLGHVADSAQATPTNSSVQVHHHNQGDDDRGDLLVRGFWARSTDCIFDVRITDTDAKSNLSRDPRAVLTSQEKQKKKKYLAPCLAQRRHFSPFVVSADGLLGREANKVLQQLAKKLADKSGKSYLVVCGFLRARMSIAIVRATHLCLRGSRIPAERISHPIWCDGAGLTYFNTH